MQMPAEPSGAKTRIPAQVCETPLPPKQLDMLRPDPTLKPIDYISLRLLAKSRYVSSRAGRTHESRRMFSKSPRAQKKMKC